METVTIYTLTVDDDNISVFAFGTEQECFNELRNLYDFRDDLNEMSDDELLTELTELGGVVVYINSHLVKLPTTT